MMPDLHSSCEIRAVEEERMTDERPQTDDRDPADAID